MSEKPILMSTWSVQQIQAGRKTQTRRLQGLEEINTTPDEWELVKEVNWNGQFIFVSIMNTNEIKAVKPRFQVGDVVWVKETYFYDASAEIKKDGLFFKADEWMRQMVEDSGEKWQPAIFMPKWASRIKGEVVREKVERLWDISERDAQAEGCEVCQEHVHYDGKIYQCSYQKAWNEINGEKYPWRNNPWVFVYSFEVIK